VRLPGRITSTWPDLIKAHIDVFPTPINLRAVLTGTASGRSDRELGSLEGMGTETCVATADCSPRASTSLMRSASERAGPPLIFGTSRIARSDVGDTSAALRCPCAREAREVSKSVCSFDKMRGPGLASSGPEPCA
jgi:hypothetical protein